MRFLVFSALLLWAALAASCDRTLEPNPEHISQIYPIEDGKHRIYHVTDTVFETVQSGPYEVQTYYRKEFTDGVETDLLGREVSKLWTYNSTDTLGTPANPIYNWIFDEVWTQYKGADYWERIEGNTRYLVLRNPAILHATWNGNLYNDGDVESYEYINIDTLMEIRGQTYAHCVYVEQLEYYRPLPDTFGSIFIVEHAYEVYAPGIGKVQKLRKNLLYQDGIPKESDSRIYYEELVSHNYD